MSEVCTEVAPASPSGSRSHVLTWLADGAREVSWVLAVLPRTRWSIDPPAHAGRWPALRHVRHLALHQARTLAAIYRLLGEAIDNELSSTADMERADAAWDRSEAERDPGALLAELAGTRFDLLQRAESASDEHWSQLEPVLLRARQHELEHLASLWRIALYWESIATAPRHASTGVPLHPADTLSPLQESH